MKIAELLLRENPHWEQPSATLFGGKICSRDEPLGKMSGQSLIYGVGKNNAGICSPESWKKFLQRTQGHNIVVTDTE